MTDEKTIPKTSSIRSMPGQSLDDYLTQLIAQHDQVPPSEVTVEYIRNVRARRIYPTARYSKGTPYGGYSTTGLTFRTAQERQERAEEIDRRLSLIN